MKPLSIVFYLKKEKVNSLNESAIYCRLRTPSSQTTLFIKCFVNAERWKQSKQLTVTRNEEEKQMRRLLSEVDQKIRNAFMSYSSKGIFLEATKLKDIFEGKSEELYTRHTLMQLFELHLKRFLDKVSVMQRSQQSLVKYKTVHSHLKSFLIYAYHTSDINLEQLSFQFVEKFDMYLRTVAKCSNNTTVKYIQFLRSVMATGIKHDIIEKDPFIKYEGKIQEVQTNFLTMEQIKRIEEKEFVCERLAIVRDTFIFSVYTGIGPTDISKLTHQNIHKDDNGNFWIATIRIKTKTSVNVPLLPPALKLIEKFSNHPRCSTSKQLIPCSSNQKTNQYLKEIQDVCEIPFNLHFYIARHTFATTITLQNGVSLESVSKMLGHKRITQTQTYAKILNQRVGKEMNELSKMFTLK